MDFRFQKSILDSVVGGVSTLDIPRLDIKEIPQARRFLSTYGYNFEDEADREKVWAIHRRAVTFIRENLLEGDESIPEVLTDPNQLKDIGYLLIYASTIDHEKNFIQRWACAILRVMHVLVHLSNDLSGVFLEEIQGQIIKPFQDFISQDPAMGATFLRSGGEQIRLHRFDIKPLKKSDSSVIKLLAKPKMVALNLLDNIGVRFVTRNLFDAFRVVRFLLSQNIVSFPHIIPDQSSNTLYPLSVFLKTMEEVDQEEKELSAEEIEKRLETRLHEAQDSADYRQRENAYSAASYRFIKFIERRLVFAEIGVGEATKRFSFFYPYEVQVMDYNTYINNISGPAAHDQYKERQRKAARRRLFGMKLQEADND